MGQGYQTIGQQLHSPTFATFGRLALGNRRQDRFNLVINFWKTACPGALVQGQVRPSVYEIPAGA